MARPKKKVEVVVDDEIIDNPEEVTIEEVTVEDFIEENGDKLVEIANLPIIETGKVNQGKKEYKDLETQVTYYK